MDNLATFKQAAHYMSLAVQAGIADAPVERLQALFDTGILSAVLQTEDSRAVDRDLLRRVLAGKPLNVAPAPAAPTPPAPKTSLFDEWRTVAVPARTEPFIVGEEFVVGKHGITYVDPAFVAVFGNMIEEPTPAMDLRYAPLKQKSLDGPILEELGGSKIAEATFGEIAWLIDQQSRRQAGPLRADGYANIFYVRGLVVNVDWSDVDVGWHVSVYSVTSPSPWFAGDRVFSRNSSLVAVSV